jgi:hypothetical protein
MTKTRCPLSGALVVALLASPATAQQRPDPVPQIGHSCPSGYSQSNGWCVPHSPTARDAIPRIGPGCPAGWQHSGHDYCVRTSPRSAVGRE